MRLKAAQSFCGKHRKHIFGAGVASGGDALSLHECMPGLRKSKTAPSLVYTELCIDITLSQIITAQASRLS